MPSGSLSVPGFDFEALTYQGDWDAGTTYNIGDYVTGVFGDGFKSIFDGNIGHDPDAPDGNWEYLDYQNELANFDSFGNISVTVVITSAFGGIAGTPDIGIFLDGVLVGGFTGGGSGGSVDVVAIGEVSIRGSTLGHPYDATMAGAGTYSTAGIAGNLSIPGANETHGGISTNFLASFIPTTTGTLTLELTEPLPSGGYFGWTTDDGLDGGVTPADGTVFDNNRLEIDDVGLEIFIWAAPSPYNAGLTGAGSYVFTEDGSLPPSRGTPVRVFLQGVGDIASLVVWQKCEFVTEMSGTPSNGLLVIRDIGLTTESFPLGARVTVDFGDGTRPLWTGYILGAVRRFWFDVDDVTHLQRQWVLRLTDINILFTRRYTRYGTDPSRITGPKLAADTPDDVAIALLTTSWLDLSTDDLDLTNEVHPVGIVNPGQIGYPWNAAMQWRDAMANIAQLPAAVFGLNPSRQLVYADVDDENAPFILSDEVEPNAVTYREMTIVSDGSNLANDFMAWGAGLGGTDHMIFRRLQDATSIATHGLWQDGFFSTAIWKQTTIDKVADSAVNGSPQSKRGRKNDRLEVRCTIFDNGLVVGDRVHFISHIWGIEDVIPVRWMKLTFPTPNEVRYDLRLSHEIDRWGFEDPFTNVDIPPGGGGGPGPEPGSEPNDCVVLVLLHDGFDRTVGPASGPFDNSDPFLSMWQFPWVNWPDDPTDTATGTADDAAEVTPTTATITIENDSFGVRIPYRGDADWNYDTITGKFNFMVDTVASTGGPFTIQFTYGAARVDIVPSTDTGQVLLHTEAGETFVTKTDWVAGDWYFAEILLDLSNTRVRVRVYPEADPTDITELTFDSNGERIGDGTYAPFIGIHLENTDTSPVVFSFAPLYSYFYALATVENILFGSLLATDQLTWGSPWVTLDPLGDPTDSNDALRFDSTGIGPGTMRVIGDGNYGVGGAQRAINGGSLELLLSVSGYTDLGITPIAYFDFGTQLSLFIGNQPALVAPSAFDQVAVDVFDGNPVNIRLQILPNASRVKIWRSTASEPNTWLMDTAFGAQLQTWTVRPNILLGQELTFGPLTGSSAPFLVAGPGVVGFTGVNDVTTDVIITDGFGRNKQWPFSDPMDGRTYAVSWGTDVFFAGDAFSPIYSAGMAWGLFGDYGPGARKDCGQTAGSLRLPQFVDSSGNPFPFDVIVRGNVNASLNGVYAYGGVSTASITVVVKSMNYGPTASLIVPSVTDYTMFGGAEAYVSFTLESGGDTQSKPFSMRFGNGSTNGGVSTDGTDYYFQWTLEVLDIFSAIAGAGPLVSATPFLPNTGGISASLSDVTIEMVLKPTFIWNVGQTEPCDPLKLGDTTGIGPSPVFGELATSITELVFRTKQAFLEKTLNVYVNGTIKTPGTDFTETDPATGTFTLTTPVNPAVDVVTTNYVTPGTGIDPTPAPVPAAPDQTPGDLQALIDATSPGNTLVVPYGTWHEHVTVPHQLDIDFQGGVITGDGSRPTWCTIGASDVTLRNLYCTDAAHDTPAPTKGQTGSLECSGPDRLKLINVHLQGGRDANLLLWDSLDSQLVGSSFNYGARSGATIGGGGQGVPGLRITDCQFNYNLTDVGYDPEWEGGGYKIGGSGSTNIVITRTEASYNHGVGQWIDEHPSNVTNQDGWGHHNDYSGIMYEISTYGTILNFRSWENGWGDGRGASPSQWGWGAGIIISSAGVVRTDGCTSAFDAAGITRINQGDRGNRENTTRLTGLNNVVVGVADRRISSWHQDGSSNQVLFTDPTNAEQNLRYWSEGNPSFAWNGDINAAAFAATRGGQGLTLIDIATRNAILTAKGMPTGRT